MATRRDRFETRATILRSAAELIAAHGVRALGVNVLAEAAGCDKVLIYRYFGGLDGVLEALGAERMLWPRVEIENEGGDASLSEALQSVVLEEWAAISGDALLLQAATAELGDDNALGRAVAAQRTERHAELISLLRTTHRVPPYVDLDALLELLSAAVTLFALRTPDTPQKWRRIEKTIGMVARALLEP
ncbi:MAG TPA: helix-turn-helix domain-containing protein [Gemmatimonadaceae bacterium]|nr:helix-turn-helix domain-containing protein [Gemmatimonadaceae bacterium]